MKKWFDNAVEVLKTLKNRRIRLGVGTMILLLFTSVVWFPIGCILGALGVIMVAVGTLINEIGETIFEQLDLD